MKHSRRISWRPKSMLFLGRSPIFPRYSMTVSFPGGIVTLLSILRISCSRVCSLFSVSSFLRCVAPVLLKKPSCRLCISVWMGAVARVRDRFTTTSRRRSCTVDMLHFHAFCPKRCNSSLTLHWMLTHTIALSAVPGLWKQSVDHSSAMRNTLRNHRLLAPWIVLIKYPRKRRLLHFPVDPLFHGLSYGLP